MFHAAVERAGLTLDVDCPRCPSRVLRRPRDVGEDRAQPALERAEVHVRGRRHGARCAPSGTRAVLTVADTGIGIARGRAAAPVRALPPARGSPRRAPTRGPASAWRSSPSWPRCTAAARRATATLGEGSDVHRAASRFGDRHLPAEQRRARPADAPAARERRRGLPGRGDALAASADGRGRPPPAGGLDGPRRGCSSSTTTPTCASTSRGCWPTSYDVRPRADGRGRARARPAPAARPRAHRRDDARARRLRAAAGAARDPRRSPSRSSCSRPAAGEEATARASRPAPTTTWSSRSRPASCARASAPTSSWTGPGARATSCERSQLLLDQAQRLARLAAGSSTSSPARLQASDGAVPHPGPSPRGGRCAPRARDVPRPPSPTRTTRRLVRAVVAEVRAGEPIGYRGAAAATGRVRVRRQRPRRRSTRRRRPAGPAARHLQDITAAAATAESAHARRGRRREAAAREHRDRRRAAAQPAARSRCSTPTTSRSPRSTGRASRARRWAATGTTSSSSAPAAPPW